jgi:hypothetical protein
MSEEELKAELERAQLDRGDEAQMMFEVPASKGRNASFRT